MKKHCSKLLLFLCFGLVIITNSVGNVAPIRTYGGMQGGFWSLERISNSGNPSLREDLNCVDGAGLEEYANVYGVDYRFILAMIKQESRFDENAVSYRGARGLMQIMPVTNDELIDELDLDVAQLPDQNVIAGIYYFSKLYELFSDAAEDDRLRLALAAYNAGPSRIYDAQDLAAYLGENPSRWSSIQHVLPLLSKRFYSLHESVWVGSKPPAGYFGSWRQTTAYVDAVMKTYLSYSSGS